MFCEFCGRPVSDYAKYCRHCGATLEYYKTEQEGRTPVELPVDSDEDIWDA